MLAVVGLWWANRRREAVLLLVGTLLAVLTVTIAKLLVGRPRPLAPLNLTPEGEPSFPSGHVVVTQTRQRPVLGDSNRTEGHAQNVGSLGRGQTGGYSSAPAPDR